MLLRLLGALAAVALRSDLGYRFAHPLVGHGGRFGLFVDGGGLRGSRLNARRLSKNAWSGAPLVDLRCVGPLRFPCRPIQVQHGLPRLRYNLADPRDSTAASTSQATVSLI